jgi:hypothetical protein
MDVQKTLRHPTLDQPTRSSLPLRQLLGSDSELFLCKKIEFSI